jgi:septum formation protein
MTRYRYEDIPDKTGPGLYKFFLADEAMLSVIPVNQTRLLYVGTTKTENDRDHFKPNSSNSTLRRTIGAILKCELNLIAYLRGSGQDPVKDSTHYRFTPDGEGRLTNWMKNNLEFSFEIFDGTSDEREARETAEIAKQHPPLNLTQWDNPIRKSLKHLRNICAQEARQNGPIARSETEEARNMLILASASPRRRELLTQAGFTFQVHPANIPEDPHPTEDPIAYVVRLAREKAEAVFAELTQNSTQSVGSKALYQGTTSVVPQRPQNEAGALAPEATLTVLGADTTVTLDNQILGKPENEADAARMLRLLSGRTHRVITGVAVVTAAHTEVAAEVTAVTFLTLSDEEIAAYIATGEPMDKAGAYAIQGRAARWIPRIQGDYFNVVGLPIALVTSLLESF